MIKKERILKKLTNLKACDSGIYKLIHSGFINEDIDKIKKLEIDNDDVSDLIFLIETFKLDMVIETTEGDKYTYIKGNQTMYDGSDGFWETNKYDEKGNKTRHDDSGGFWETWEYNEQGKWNRHDNSHGLWKTREYDEKGNLTRGDDSDGYWQTWTCNEKGRKTRYDTSNGYWETWRYDEKGRKTRYDNSNGDWHTWEYDTKGTLINIEMSEVPFINKYKILEKRT